LVILAEKLNRELSTARACCPIYPKMNRQPAKQNDEITSVEQAVQTFEGVKKFWTNLSVKLRSHSNLSTTVGDHCVTKSKDKEIASLRNLVGWKITKQRERSGLEELLIDSDTDGDDDLPALRLQ